MRPSGKSDLDEVELQLQMKQTRMCPTEWGPCRPALPTFSPFLTETPCQMFHHIAGWKQVQHMLSGSWHTLISSATQHMLRLVTLRARPSCNTLSPPHHKTGIFAVPSCTNTQVRPIGSASAPSNLCKSLLPESTQLSISLSSLKSSGLCSRCMCLHMHTICTYNVLVCRSSCNASN